jgi:hypothetical protein
VPTYELRELYQRLAEDELRKTVPFDPALATAHKVLVHPFASDGERAEALECWLQKDGNQPCLFGRIAAAAHRIQFCFLSDQDLFTCDEHVGSKVRDGLLAWKRRSLRPSRGVSVPAHGFMLVVASDRVAFARPDENLYRLACKIRDLWGCNSTQPAHGTVFWESLFLEKPDDRSYAKFTFSVDFFAAQGDGRWWQDHRTPGGLAFTANSAGHMRRYREWYEDRGDQREWLLKTAMLTIDYAAQTPFGRATYLRPIVNDRPVVDRVACPFANPDKLNPNLKGKDWTRYGGNLHTDHSIRPEFFEIRREKSADIQNRDYLQDFVYLYDAQTQDHVRFAAGQNVSREEVVEAIGDPEQFTEFAGPSPATTPAEGTAAHVVHPDVEKLLSQCRDWKVRAEDLESLVA